MKRVRLGWKRLWRRNEPERELSDDSVGANAPDRDRATPARLWKTASDEDPTPSDRVVRGYHGTTLDVAATILEEQSVEPSRNPDDWLGWGTYFWEDGKRRAWIWAEHRFGANAAVVSVNIKLDNCLNLVDGAQHPVLQTGHELVRRAFERDGRPLPINDGIQRPLDCLVINYVCESLRPEVTAVRAPFEDGDPVYPGSRIRSMAHVQICVKNPACYSSPFRIEEHH
jgi:hypothetical protein